LPRTPVTVDVTGQLVFLGTGTSSGVPVIGCGCPTCTSSDPQNQRTRCALVVGLPQGHLLVDSPPDLRTQLLREKIGLIHAVLFTHSHADHLFGLDDLRLFPAYLRHELPVYCEESVEQQIRRSFEYAFDDVAGSYPLGSVPRLSLRRVSTDPFEVLGASIIPIRLHHGRFRVLGFRFGNIAYCTDVNAIPGESLSLLSGLDVLILDALRPRPHPTHFSLDEAIEMARQIGAKRTFFTHMSHELEHAETNARLPPGMELAYDGLKLLLA
jgi:phosphoribosyl 1,2-cyclic phosphate phosphodiesterase